MVVFGENATEIGNIQVGDTIQVEMPRISNYRVIFTLGQGREDWLGTDLVRRDTLRINDKTEIFEIEYFEINE